MTPDTQVRTKMTDDHLRAINIAAQIELAEGVTTHDYLRLTEIESLLASLVSGRSVVVDTERYALLERTADRIAILDALIEQDRVIVDNNQLPPVEVFFDENESVPFYSLSDAGEQALVRDYPAKPTRSPTDKETAR